MTRPLNITSEFYKEDFLSAAKSTKDKRHYQRLLALHHVQQGKAQNSVCHLLGVAKSSVQIWMKKYKNGGIDALKQSAIPGRTRKLSLDKLEEFAKEFISNQESLSGGRLMATDAQSLLKEKYSCNYKISSVYHLLHEVGLSWISGRSQNPNSSIETQDTFKKTSLN